MSDAPIGVFDSGLGGLSAVKHLRRCLPHEDIVYFGDTGRVPYGSKSRDTIYRYAQQDADFLLSKNVKIILAACGTVSSVAGDLGEKLTVPYTGVLTPTANAAVKATKNGKIAVLGTSATVKSKSYNKEIAKIERDICVISQECPLFVPLVENGFIDRDDEIVKLTVERYLKDIKKAGADTIILGCTHYPLLKAAIGDYVGENVVLIDSGKETALYIKKLISDKGLLCNRDTYGKCEFYVSDTTEDFSRIAELFLNEDIRDRVYHTEI